MAIYRKRRMAPKRGRKRIVRKRVFRKGKAFRKTKLPVIKVKSLGLNTTYSRTYLRPNKFGMAMKKKYWLGAKNQWRTAYTDKITVAGNSDQQQNHFTVSYFSPTEINNYLTAFSLSPGATGTANNTNRIYHNSVQGDVVITNSSNVNVEIEIYSYVAKRECSDSPGSLWYKGMADQRTTPVFDNTQYYNMSPLDAVAVGQSYKCFKITRVELNPGQSHKRKFTQHLCRPINNELLDQSIENGSQGLRGITQYDMFVVRSLSIETGTNNAGAGVSTARVNYYVTKKYDFKYLFDMDTTIKFDTLPVEPTTGNAIYNQGSGASAAPAVI